ncbi:Serine--tRNA ligase [Candidatus Norongarragalina meridionalis]|nr:Serine--tRNA ligase [Candidatus Norongarragalina meridionalis]
MLDLKWVRENPDVVRKDLKRRRMTTELLDDLLTADLEYRRLKQEVDNLRAERNRLTEQVRTLKKEGKNADAELKKAAGIPDMIKTTEETADRELNRVKYSLMRLPNILHESVPDGKDDTENKELRKWGTPKTPSFNLRTHEEIAEKMGGADFERGAKISGAGFCFIKGNLALMDIALQRFAIDSLMKKGFTLLEPPLMMRRDSYEGVTDLADFENVMYGIKDDDSYLIATSEHPIAAMHRDEVLEELPLLYAGVSPCFRREIGAHGVDTKGLFRMHQFQKVEQFVFCAPEESWEWHEKLLKNAEEIWQALGIPYSVVAVCTGDMGTVAAKKYDIEAWMPREGKYKEVVSCSNCTSYQAVRLNIKRRIGKQGALDEKKEWLHTLNSTAIATSRALRAILENNQHEDGSVEIPKVLRPYMNNMTELR